MPPRKRGHEWNGNGPWSWTYGLTILYFPCFIKPQFKITEKINGFGVDMGTTRVLDNIGWVQSRGGFMVP